MGTRSLTKIIDHQQRPILAIYRQFDSYPRAHGRDLRRIAGKLTLVNGLRSGDTSVANGMDCLAATILAKLKKKPGGIYVWPQWKDESKAWTDYKYTIYPQNEITSDVSSRVMVKVETRGSTIYDGLLCELPLDLNEEDDEEVPRSPTTPR